MAAGSLGNWKLVFLFFAAVTILSALWLQFTPIHEKPVTQSSSSFAASFALLKDKTILILFLGIVFVVGVDVGLNTTVPKFLMERCNIPLEKAGLGTSLYFVARTLGTFVGAILLVKLSGRNFFIVSMLVAIPALLAMLLIGNLWGILSMVFILGFAVANVFSIIFSAALKRKPDNANEISGLLIMGVAGGAIIPLVMGITSDSLGQTGGMAVLLAALAYLLFSAVKMKKEFSKIRTKHIKTN
jgi:fucose permease